MYEALYYILAVLTIAFCMFTAFSEKRTAYYFVLFLFFFCGLLVLLNSPLIALVLMMIIFISVILLMLFEKFNPASEPAKNNPVNVKNYSFLIITGLFTAIVSSLVSSTRLPVFDIDFTKVNFSLIFAVYLPVILLMAVVISAILPFVLSAFRNKEIV